MEESLLETSSLIEALCQGCYKERKGRESTTTQFQADILTWDVFLIYQFVFIRFPRL